MRTSKQHPKNGYCGLAPGGEEPVVQSAGQAAGEAELVQQGGVFRPSAGAGRPLRQRVQPVQREEPRAALLEHRGRGRTDARKPGGGRPQRQLHRAHQAGRRHLLCTS